MKVEIISMDNGSGMNTMLRVHKHHFRDIFESKPFCDIEEDDFIECFSDPDKAARQLEKGKIVFDVPRAILEDKAKVIYNSYIN